MVVASSNNGAVENISKELPLKAEVEPYSNLISYFKEALEKNNKSNNWGLFLQFSVINKIVIIY